MQKLPVFKTIKESLCFIKENYKASLVFIFFITLVQYCQNLVHYINPIYSFIVGIAFLFYYAFINPLFNIKTSETPAQFIKRYAFSGLIYANVVLMALVLYDIYNADLFYFMIYGASLYIAYFFIIRLFFQKPKLFSKKIFFGSIKKMAAIMLIIFAGFMVMYFSYRFLSFILEFAAIPEFIQSSIISRKTFIEYIHHTAVIGIYIAIFSVFIISCFAWVGEVNERNSSILYAFIRLGKNFFRFAAIILSIFIITFGVNYLLYLAPLKFYIPNHIINSAMLLFAFITYLETYKFLYKQKSKE